MGFIWIILQPDELNGEAYFKYWKRMVWDYQLFADAKRL